MRPMMPGRLALTILSFLPLCLPGNALTGVSTNVSLTITTPGPIYFGQSVDGYARVSSSDGSDVTGTITFYDGAVNICVISVTTGASCPTSTGAGFVAGTHLLRAVYSGDADHLGSSSSTASVLVLPDSTTTGLASSASTVSYGESVVLTAAVQGEHGSVAGTVTFLDGPNVLGVAALNSAGAATLAVSNLGVGTHVIRAMYGGDQNSEPSTSAYLSEVVQAARVSTVTMLSSDVNPAASGRSVVFTASVMMSSKGSTQPTGTVVFLDGGAVLGTGTLDRNGQASLSTTSLGVGSHQVTASYSGDVGAEGSVSAGFAQVVNAGQAATAGSFTISAAAVRVKVGQMSSVVVMVSPVNGFNQAVQLGCSNLPGESACTFGTAIIPAGGGSTTLQLSTMAPRDCGTTTPYSAGLGYAAPMVAGLLMLFVPGKRRSAWKGLMMAAIALGGMAAMMGCGNCTDLGTRPGTYTIQVTGKAVGGSAAVSQNVTLTVGF